jgi:hypothetical protein
MDKKEEVKKDIKKYSAIDAVSSTPGGKVLVTSLKKDITSTIDELTSKYKTSSHIEMIALCATLHARLTLLRVLNRAKKVKKLAQEELEFILKEEE